MSLKEQLKDFLKLRTAAALMIITWVSAIVIIMLGPLFVGTIGAMGWVFYGLTAVVVYFSLRAAADRLDKRLKEREETDGE